MGYKFERAKRSNVPLLIGLAGGTGSGKTWSAMLLAQGLSGGKPFAVVDTENGRANLYADDFEFDRVGLEAPFTAEKYLEAIQDGDKAGYPVIIVDSASHEYAGEGGLLDQQEAELERMAGSDYQKRERVKMASWIKPKMRHKTFVTKLLQVNAHLILCFRAEPKTEMTKVNGKTVVQEKKGLIGLRGWFPVTEKNLPYEMTAYFLLDQDKPGIPHPIKLISHHKAMFPADKQITVSAGEQLAAWAAGGSSKAPVNGSASNSDRVADFEILMGEASTKSELADVARQIKDANLSQEDRQELGTAYRQNVVRLGGS